MIVMRKAPPILMPWQPNPLVCDQCGEPGTQWIRESGVVITLEEAVAWSSDPTMTLVSCDDHIVELEHRLMDEHHEAGGAANELIQWSWKGWLLKVTGMAQVQDWFYRWYEPTGWDWPEPGTVQHMRPLRWGWRATDVPRTDLGLLISEGRGQMGEAFTSWGARRKLRRADVPDLEG